MQVPEKGVERTWKGGGRGENFKKYAVQPSERKLKRLGFFRLGKDDNSKGSRTRIYTVVKAGEEVNREQFTVSPNPRSNATQIKC